LLTHRTRNEEGPYIDRYPRSVLLCRTKVWTE